MTILLELIRIIVIFFIIYLIFGSLIYIIYLDMSTDIETFGWMVLTAFLILYFVLYRNKFQFSGWYKGKERKSLPKNITIILVSSGSVLLIYHQY